MRCLGGNAARKTGPPATIPHIASEARVVSVVDGLITDVTAIALPLAHATVSKK